MCRGRKAVATGADIVTTACPFCTVMMPDGIATRAEHAGDADAGMRVGAPKVLDIATLLLDRVRATAGTD